MQQSTSELCPENDLQEDLVEFWVWIVIISGFSKNSFNLNVLLIQERKISETILIKIKHMQILQGINAVM